MSLTSFNMENHSRTIIHIDFDCFYAQVEMIKNPSLSNVPLGVQQKQLVVTSNHIARSFGVKKCMSVVEAKEVCPNLVLVNGEDLYDYRKISYKITNHLHRYSQLVERLGLDENYVDVTDLVATRSNNCYKNCDLVGYIFGQQQENCDCGCYNRLKIGSFIAQEIRDGIKNEFKLTSCAGIAHNKLLAKLVGSVNKPNKQTTVLPNSALELILSLDGLSKIPGIGAATIEILNGLNIRTIEDLHNCKFEMLQIPFGKEKAEWIVNLSYGCDLSPVKPTGKPQSIGLEDSCKLANVETEIRAKFQQLLSRLMILVREDGRIPTTLKVTVRKVTDISKVSHREMRQCNISPSLFKVENNSVYLSDQSESNLLTTIMRLFSKLVNSATSYNIRLLGLSFTKFKDPISGRNSIASYFVKDVSVQSVTNIENTNYISDAPNLYLSSCSSSCEEIETDKEPLPKKSKIVSFKMQHKHMNEPEYSSPSKLKIGSLRLNSIDNDVSCSTNENNDVDTNQNVFCPPNANKEVFKQLPVDIQQELWNEWKWKRDNENVSNNPVKRVKTNTLYNYFVQE